MRAAAAALGLVLMSAPAWALTTPTSSSQDPNMRSIAYDPMQRIRIANDIGQMTNITFDKRESIYRVLFGQPDLWNYPDAKDVKDAPLGNNLPLWPAKVGQTTMVVTTITAENEQTSYQFILVSKPAQDTDDPEATYGLVIQNQRRDQIARVQQYAATLTVRRAAWQDAQARKAAAAAAAQLAADQAAAPGNCHYVGQGSDDIRPRSTVPGQCEVWDDGQSTSLRFPGAMRLPAPFRGPPSAEESLPFSMHGDIMVIPRILPQIDLRLGQSVVYIYNRAYSPVGVNPATGAPADPQTGTTSPNVVRSLRPADGAP